MAVPGAPVKGVNMIGMSDKPLDITFIARERLNKGPNGTAIVVNGDGTVVSVQPDGSVQSRPAGTAGPYETATVVGDKLVYHSGGHIYAFALLSSIPN